MVIIDDSILNLYIGDITTSLVNPHKIGEDKTSK